MEANSILIPLAATPQRQTRAWIFKTRIISLLIVLFFCVYEFTATGVQQYFRYFTQWGLFITNLYFLTALVFPKWSYLHTFFQIIWTNEALITIIFWLILLPVYIYHPDAASRFKTDGLFTIIDKIAAHFVPIASLTFEFSLSSWEIGKLEFLYSYFLMFCYAMMDGSIVMLGYSEAYPIVMTWHNALSCGTLVVLNLIIVGIFMVSYFTTRKKK